MINKQRLIIIIIIAVLVTVIGINYYQNLTRIHRLNKEIEKLEQEISQARQTNKELTQQLENLQDPEYIERVAREKLGLVRPGEVLLIPVEEDEDKDKEKAGEID